LSSDFPSRVNERVQASLVQRCFSQPEFSACLDQALVVFLRMNLCYQANFRHALRTECQRVSVNLIHRLHAIHNAGMHQAVWQMKHVPDLMRYQLEQSKRAQLKADSFRFPDSTRRDNSDISTGPRRLG